ncbi:MAG: hypothetical protein JOZ62_00630 [Acidobacteriaceae bacterium]|nr:hypothetical protein [Acidobacteriaceae bacterium]
MGRLSRPVGRKFRYSWRIGPILVFALNGVAQQQAGEAGNPNGNQPQPNAPTVTQPGNVPAPSVAPGQKPPPQEASIIEDGGFSVEPLYWLNRAQPALHGGAMSSGFEFLPYSGHAKPADGAMLSFPAGKQNSLRVSYFRVQGSGNSVLSADTTVFGQAFNSGDLVTQSYTLQSAKISWDYLSYTWYRPSAKLRLKTLYEVQYVNVKTALAAPFKEITVDTSGNTSTNTASGSKSLVYPSLGVELEEALGKHFRWELKGSGFAIPHRPTLWDAEASLVVHLSHAEVLVGGKAFHFKTSPKADQYFTDTLYGPYVGIRWYWGRE